MILVMLNHFYNPSPTPVGASFTKGSLKNAGQFRWEPLGVLFYSVGNDSNPPMLRTTSPVYGFCNPNHRFGQNLTLGKGGL